MLAIEIDGDTHAEQKQYDKDRTKNLNKFGVKVIRYTNAEVLNNLGGVYQDLHKRVFARKPLNLPYQGALTIITLSMAFSRFGLCFMRIYAKLMVDLRINETRQIGRHCF